MTDDSTSGRSSPADLNEQLFQVHAMIASGQAAQAVGAARALADHPLAGVPARALQALACAMAGEGEEALQVLQALPAAATLNKAEVLLAAGSAWFKLERLGPALEHLRAAHALQPGHPLVLARLGACLLADGAREEAMPLLQAAVQAMPDVAGTWLNLARAQLEGGDAEQALRTLDHAARLPDREPGLYLDLRVETLRRLKREDEAESLLRAEAGQGGLQAVKTLVGWLVGRGRHDDAGRELAEALESHPEDIGLMELAAEIAEVRGRFMEADRLLERALAREPENADLWRRRAMLGVRGEGSTHAREAADKALALTADKTGLSRALALVAHAHVLADEDRLDDAQAAYRQALELAPQCAPALNGLGHLLLLIGRVDEATEVFERLKVIAPMQGWSQLIHARKVPDDPEVLEAMAQAARQPSLEGPVSSHILFTLAAAWERKGEHERAWAFAAEANEASRALLDYRPEVHRLRVEREMARFSKAFMDSRRGHGDPSRLPVFVLGMPRSGTTLVEQILGSHSQVFGAGELSLVPDLVQTLQAWEFKLGTRREYPECVDDMTEAESRRFAQRHLERLQAYAPEAMRIVDKLPHNFEHVGLIKLLFPNARILHLQREPRDVALSNFFVDYAAKHGGMGFAYDLSWIGEQMVDHQRLMDHWHAVFPNQILEVDYDALVEDVEGWARRIVEHLDLPWEDGVLAFQKLERAVKTASVWQVRQPVYTSSKAKWKLYEAHLQPLEATLAEVPPPPVPLPLPRLAPGLFPLGMEHLHGGRPAEAEAAFRQLLVARPAHAAAHHFLGAALYQQGRAEEARREMRRSVELLDRHAQWLENLAVIEEAMGDADKAKALREQVAELTGGPAAAPVQAAGAPRGPVPAVDLAALPAQGNA